MKKSTRNLLIFAGLGFVGYMVFRRMGTTQATQAAMAAKQGAAIAQRFVAPQSTAADAAIAEYGMQGMGWGGRVVSEQ